MIPRIQLAFLKTIYRLDLDDQSWMEELAAVGHELLDVGKENVGTLAYMHEPDGEFRLRRTAAATFDYRIEEDSAEMISSHRKAIVKRTAYEGSFASTLTERMQSAEVMLDDSIRRFSADRGIFDFQGIGGVSSPGSGVVVGCPLLEVKSMTPRKKTLLNLLAFHLGAAARLRSRARQAPLENATAIFDMKGNAAHLEKEAEHALGKFRAAVLLWEDIHRGQHNDVLRAVEAWKGMIDGTWSLVDVFDNDGRRFMVVRRNEHEVIDPRRLSRREQEVLELCAWHEKLESVAYLLGVDASTVSSTLSSAMKKLGIKTRVDLVHFVHRLQIEYERERFQAE